ncbi:Inorganic pyrophosphatase [Pedosphaera parvula Ellin514]|uniref:inorganic diphosphatase n=2 Tax=Pedosphaera TaxID=1032526 RepID=B9XJY6_PEDPL|nr:Inorganic pyrophosphatase [Pedosphaera parvula Ellin514]
MWYFEIEEIMNSPFLQLPAFDKETGKLNTIIETSKGVRNKYKFMPDIGLFALDKSLATGMVFPHDFGFIPSTKGEDGDPLDVLVLMEESTFCGCIVRTRLIGVIEAKQKELSGKIVRNDRFIAVFDKQPTYADVEELTDLNARVVDEIEHFFISYTEMEGSKKFMPLKRSGSRAAQRLIKSQMSG